VYSNFKQDKKERREGGKRETIKEEKIKPNATSNSG
jgi:hypothetical protein